jgi:hypothetical protein
MDELKKELQRMIDEYQGAMSSMQLLFKGMMVTLNERTKNAQLLMRKLDAIEKSKEQPKE